MCKNPISIIIRIQHNIKVLPEILKACEQLHPLEIILTINGYIDDSIDIAQSYNCKIITLEEPSELNNCYVIGATKAKGKYLLFLDANYIIQSSLLTQFLQPLLDESADIVLNNLDDFLSKAKANYRNDLAAGYESFFIVQIYMLTHYYFLPMQ